VAKKTAKKTVRKPTRKVPKKAVKNTTSRATKKSTRKTTKKTTKRTRESVAKATKKSEPKKAATPAKPRGLKIGSGRSSSRAEELRSILEAKRVEIIQEIRRARQDSVKTDRESYAEVGDLVSASVEKERAFEYGEIGVQLLREIDSALQKLKEGTFGICEMCTKPIGIRRLKVMPSARLCIKCKSLEEASGPGARSRSLTQED
jgi:DnaK suppressor protein